MRGWGLTALPRPLCRDIPLVVLAYLAWKLYKKTNVVSLESIPLEQAFRQAEENPKSSRSDGAGGFRP